LGEPKRTELKVNKQRAVLVSVLLRGKDTGEVEPLDELRGLAETAGVKIVGSLVQNRQWVDKKTYLGKGKLEELKQLVETQNADVIIFDTSLSPAQGRNIEEATGKTIVDRSELIIDIFATHARTAEAKLQVELAQLLYTRPRLKRMWTHLERTEGAVGTRGPGEQQIETDRRLIDTRVSELKSRIKELEQRRERLVKQRHDHFTVSIVGYTNAGKSTLMNALTGADVFVADQLFATLDTRTRSWVIPHWGTVLLSDTVGFIRDLPHHLVASFKSTLAEALHADLLLHVVDASHPAAAEQIKTVNKVLEDVGIDGSTAILVLNKVDAVSDPSLVHVLRGVNDESVSVSALRKTGFETLTQAVADRLGGGYLDATVEASAGNGKLLSFLNTHAEIKHTTYTDNRVAYECRIPKRFLGSLRMDDTVVKTAGDGEQ
jgi:GTP-binding protein HflX